MEEINPERNCSDGEIQSVIILRADTKSINTLEESAYSDRYPELMLRDKVVQNYNDNQYSPLVFNQIKFNDSLSMHNDFVTYSIPIILYIHVLHYKRVWLLQHVKTMKKEVEILIRDLDKELDNLMTERIKKY